ncbi:MAG TPA: LuxR C-terminal-related transcriptional regulator, partial [Thermomicrobiales bacterium]|nr:LuxR C-terminal-related transcriptional regulator [Thermomicrobiales bacterium]
WYLGWQGLVAAARGDIKMARAIMVELDGLLAGLPDAARAGEPLALLAQLALLLDERARIERLAPSLEPLAGRFHDFLIDRLRGEIALRQGDRGRAERLLAAAETTARRERLPLELARVLEARANLALARGQRESAAALLAEAAAHVDRLSNAIEAERLRGRIGALAGSSQSDAPAGLTARELDVLRLVAAGKSNRIIAAELSLSEKTIERHLSNIYVKTGAENRAGATAFALRQGVA